MNKADNLPMSATAWLMAQNPKEWDSDSDDINLIMEAYADYREKFLLEKELYTHQEVFNIIMDFWMEKRPEFKRNPVCISRWFEENKKK